MRNLNKFKWIVLGALVSIMSLFGVYYGIKNPSPILTEDHKNPRENYQKQEEYYRNVVTLKQDLNEKLIDQKRQIRSQNRNPTYSMDQRTSPKEPRKVYPDQKQNEIETILRHHYTADFLVYFVMSFFLLILGFFIRKPAIALGSMIGGLFVLMHGFCTFQTNFYSFMPKTKCKQLIMACG